MKNLDKVIADIKNNLRVENYEGAKLDDLKYGDVINQIQRQVKNINSETRMRSYTNETVVINKKEYAGFWVHFNERGLYAVCNSRDLTDSARTKLNSAIEEQLTDTFFADMIEETKKTAIKKMYDAYKKSIAEIQTNLTATLEYVETV